MTFVFDEGIYFESSHILFASYYILSKNVKKYIFILLCVNQFITSAKQNKSVIYYCSILSGSQIFFLISERFHSHRA
jgi:hypothetical protein